MIRTSMVGIDGTDREIESGVYGTPPDGADYLVLGHEAVGRVNELGEEVEDLGVGQCVVPTVRRPDGCPNCLAGESDMCLTGNYREHGIFRLHGFASDLALSDASFLVPVPAGLGDVAVLLEPLSIGEKALQQILKIQERMVWVPERAFVVGAGPLGLLTALILRLRGMEVWVTATRGQDSLKARIVGDMGGKYVNAREDPISGWDEEFDIIMEATGALGPAVDAAGLLRRNGIMCIMGNYREPGSWKEVHKILYRMVLRNQLIFGSVNSNREHFERGLSDMRQIRREFGGVLETMITRTLEPGEFKRAFKPDREDVKTVIDFSGD